MSKNNKNQINLLQWECTISVFKGHLNLYLKYDCFVFPFEGVANVCVSIKACKHTADSFFVHPSSVGSHTLRQQLVYQAWIDLADLGAQSTNRSTSGSIEGQMGDWVGFRAKQEITSPPGPPFWGFDASIRAQGRLEQPQCLWMGKGIRAPLPDSIDSALLYVVQDKTGLIEWLSV